jgi:hypothetical protein
MGLDQIAFELPNRPGALAGVAKILAKERINLAAISVDSTEKKGHVRLIVSDPEKAMKCLKKARYPAIRQELLAVHLEDRAGSFLRVLDVLSTAKVNIVSVAILFAKEGSQSLVALLTDDLAKARRLLQQAGFMSQTAESLVTNADLIAASPAIPQESVGFLL